MVVSVGLKSSIVRYPNQGGLGVKFRLDPPDLSYGFKWD